MTDNPPRQRQKGRGIRITDHAPVAFCPVCGHPNLTARGSKVYVAVERHGYAGEVRCCDRCRRVLLTCDVCTAWVKTKQPAILDGCNIVVGECRRQPDTGKTTGRRWCIGGFKQAYPLSRGEIADRVQQSGDLTDD